MNKMKELDWSHVMVYLCGPMDYAKNLGVKWRNDAHAKLVQLGIKDYNVLNPCNKPLSNIAQPLSEEQKLINELRDKEDWEGLANLMERIIHVDLRMVDKADILIVNLSDSERTTGTIHEIVVASLAQKPIYVIDNKGKGHVSGWLFGLLGHDRIFNSLDEVIEEIRKVKEDGVMSKKDEKHYLVFDFNKRELNE